MGVQVYLLWFVQECQEEQDIELLIGVYETESAAKAAIQRLGNKSGFKDFPEGFQVDSYEIGKDSWTEGFVRDNDLK